MFDTAKGREPMTNAEAKEEDKKVSKKLISAFVQGAISDDNEREKVLKYIEEISE